MSQPADPPPGSGLLALDYGEARIGIAGSDSLGLLAHPVETVPAQPWPDALHRIAAIFHERQAKGLVIGLPVRADGEEGRAADKVRRFSEMLAPCLPQGTPIHFQDEYRSTVEAAAHLRASGKRTKTHRPLIDQAAAVVILQAFLDTLVPPPPCP